MRQQRQRILRRPETEERSGLRGATLDREEEAGRFPWRLLIGPRAIGWYETEVDAWVRNRPRGRPRVRPTGAVQSSTE
jgi:prophage regulatory protein